MRNAVRLNKRQLDKPVDKKLTSIKTKLAAHKGGVKETAANANAVNRVISEVLRAQTSQEALRLALDAVRESFGWAYASYWALDKNTHALRFVSESGDVSPEFKQITERATFKEGVGLSGRTWRARDLVFVPDLSEVQDCVRAPAAQRAGIRSAVCFPILVAGEVIGTMDFLSLDVITLSDERTVTLRSVGQLVSTVFERLEESRRQKESAENTEAMNRVFQDIATARNFEEAIDITLNGVRSVFGWAYGSYWKLDRESNALRFSRESGTVNSEFRRVTETTSFKEGVGLSGRAWKNRELFFVPDLGEMKDCPRAPVAQRAGVRSGVCLPIIVNGEIMGTMDFFSMERLTLSEGRMQALGTIGQIASAALERLYASDEMRRKVDLILGVVHEAAQGNLTLEVPVTGDDALGRLGAGMAKMLNDLRSVIKGVIGAANQFSGNAEAIAQGSGSLSESAQAQSATIEEMTASVEQLTSSIQSISKNAQDADQIARTTAREAEEGRAAVDRSIQAMQAINKSAEEITEIVKVIGEIASQTNLLALNAAIEAARAGEHGLGFAVVADEVRKLAERASEATKEISNLIKESTQRVSQGSELSLATADALKRIVGGVEKTASSIAQIAAATEEQSATATEVNNGIAQVSQTTEKNAGAAREMAASADELSKQAAHLNGLVQGFKA